MQIVKMLIIFLMTSGNLFGGWLERKAEGWAWYEEQNQDANEEVASVSVEKIETSMEKLVKARKQLEELLADAILNPTTENAQKYMLEQRKWVKASTEFSQAWGKVLLQHPELDPTATTFATSQYGRQLQKAIEQDEKENLIKAVAQEYGLFFFYEGSNKVSRAFAMVVQAFIKKYDWQVVGIAMDGILLKEISNSKINVEVAKKMGVTILPALLAVNPKTQEVVPVAFGLQALDQIEKNVFNQIRKVEEIP